MKQFRNFSIILVSVVLVIYALVAFYPYIFSRHVKGKISAVQQVTTPVAVMALTSDNKLPSQVFSYSVGVTDEKTNEIVTGSTEDRQWAVAREGQCVEAQFFPYPPWALDKWGTYYNVRLLKLSDCLTPVTQ